MNVDNILKVADAIEHHSVPDMVFHMNYEFTKSPVVESADMKARGIGVRDCGAAACIIGWTNTVLPSSGPIGSFSRASQALGLDYDTAESLFYPENYRFSYDDVTSEQAASVLRKLASTGSVDWDVE